MNRQMKGSELRRKLLQKRLNPEAQGGFTIHTAKLMAEPLGGRPAECILTGHCRTFVFEFPGSHLVAEERVEHQLIYAQDGLKAAIVSDLAAYFEKAPAKSLHFSIDVSLRAGISNTYEKALKASNGKTDGLFLVIEEHAEFAATELTSGQCFTIDEVRDGTAIIEGGRIGERAMLAFPALGCPWPDFHADMYRVNIVLTAVKAVQNVTGHVRQLYECSCFVSSKGDAVFILNPTMSASLQNASALKPPDLVEKADRIGAMLQAMMSDSEPVASELFDAIVLDKTMDDGYLRLSYLRLWQAVEDARRHLSQPNLLNERTVIAGKRTPIELRAYRNKIAHWHTGRIDHSYLNALQYTVMELLRRKYGGDPQSGG